MNKQIIVLVLIVLLAAQLACIFSASPEPGPTAIPTIGLVNRIQGSVEAGPESALEEVNPKRDINNDDAIHIKDNGKASLDFGYGLTFTLYNDTTSEGTRVDKYETALQVTTYLSEGGLNGYNPPDSKTVVFLPNEAKIIILGTHYFITYDPQTDVTWVYNLDGTLQYALPGGSPQDLTQRSLVQFNRAEVIQVYEGLTFSTDDFDRFATQFNSPLQGVEELLRVAVPTETPTSTPTPTPTSTETLTPTSTLTYTPTFTLTSTLTLTLTLTPSITTTDTLTPEPLTEIYRKYISLGGANGFLGFPVGPETRLPDGGSYRDFQGGSIYWSSRSGAFEVHGEIQAHWLKLGDVKFLGYPVTDETTTPDGIGRFNHFEGGSIYWSPDTGAHEVHGAIRDKWASDGWEESCLGFPTSDEQDFSEPDGLYTRISYFHGGSITWGPNVGASINCTPIIR